MTFNLLPLPYPRSALEPHMSAKTLEFHYGKHHRAYVTNLNNLVQNTPLAAKSLESIIRETVKGRDIQQCRANPESRLLLEFHEASRRGRARRRFDPAH